MITWDKVRIGMESRTRSRSEYLLIIQMPPIAARATWHDRSIPDVRRESVKRTHPHAKPQHLQIRLIESVTHVGDAVCDPCAGGYSVLQCCKATGRTFIGCDLETPADNEQHDF